MFRLWKKRQQVKPPPAPREPGRYFVLKVDDTFRIRGRGLVVAGVLDPTLPTQIRIGDATAVTRPDGSVLRCFVKGIEHTNPLPEDLRVGLLLDLSTETLIPAGSECWLLVE